MSDTQTDPATQKLLDACVQITKQQVRDSVSGIVARLAQLADEVGPLDAATIRELGRRLDGIFVDLLDDNEPLPENVIQGLFGVGRIVPGDRP